ncbi:MAG: hypothetical protein Q7J72_01820 [Candidatus Omnitrophota bacterium]|nr:hypothetical protein [Candidatus Omnitrophota bacterium]
MDKKDEKNLKVRYLTWLYKTVKEAFDRYERKFTQLEIDGFVLREMEKELKGSYMPQEKKALEKLVNDFRNYVDEKEKACLKLKYKGKKIDPEFIFLDVKLIAIEKAILKEIGHEGLEKIKAAYHDEMVKRILEEKQEQR